MCYEVRFEGVTFIRQPGEAGTESEFKGKEAEEGLRAGKLLPRLTGADVISIHHLNASLVLQTQTSQRNFLGLFFQIEV